ncbi:hypothetical protein PHMEG_00018547 [Phytophthora megakarya]|uniref:Uncharacterized protein n=1 Tax=Phytophthora megakarya TaxID=4795 RepID=A0A225VV40_9STRA|nr:hypothetical protein PHMEG_00018547 [Phytophthora megakarya]
MQQRPCSKQQAAPIAPPVQQPPPIAQQDQGHAAQQQQQPVGYPDARQKKLAICPFSGKEVYVGLGSGFLEWGWRFERQAFLAQASCGFLWPGGGRGEDRLARYVVLTSGYLGVSDVHPGFRDGLDSRHVQYDYHPSTDHEDFHGAVV